jgi:hypothetical protein
VDPLLADEGAVAGEAVVEQRALAGDDLDLGVQGGDLLVPAASPRPTQSSAVPSSIATIRCSPSPSRRTRKGRPLRSASICAFSSAALVCRGPEFTGADPKRRGEGVHP